MAYFAPYIDAAGLHIPTYADILEDLVQQAKLIYGQDIYLDNDSQDYQFISAFAAKAYDVMQGIVLAYNSRSPAFAVGSALAGLVRLNGIKPLSATASTATVTLTGTAGAQIIGGIVADANNIQWALPGTVTIGNEGTVDVLATCKQLGAVAAPAGTITQIVTPARGWTSVTNDAAATLGKEAETDAQLRARQKISVANPGQAIVTSIEGAIAAIDGVKRRRVYENYTDSEDENGLPPHSITAVVDGGKEYDIALQIFLHKSPGCGTNGAVTVPVIDKYGETCNIKFDRPTEVPIFVEVTVKKLQGYSNDNVIINAIVEYIESLEIGDDVYASSLIGAALSAMPSLTTPTFTVSSVKIGKAASSLSTVDIAIAITEAASCLADNVTIVITQ